MMENMNQITVQLKIYIVYLGNQGSQSLMKLHFNANISRKKPVKNYKNTLSPTLNCKLFQ